MHGLRRLAPWLLVLAGTGAATACDGGDQAPATDVGPGGKADDLEGCEGRMVGVVTPAEGLILRSAPLIVEETALAVVPQGYEVEVLSTFNQRSDPSNNTYLWHEVIALDRHGYM